MLSRVAECARSPQYRACLVAARSPSAPPDPVFSGPRLAHELSSLHARFIRQRNLTLNGRLVSQSPAACIVVIHVSKYSVKMLTKK